MTEIPVLINNRDRLTTTRHLVGQVAALDGARPVVIDNASTFPPLIAWYETAPCQVIRLGINAGPRAPWHALLHYRELAEARHYIVTDSDLDLTGVPSDVLSRLAAGISEYPWAVKCGLSLEINDLPEGYPFRQMVIDRETPMWADRVDDRFFRADIDTTFAMYRKNPPWRGDYGPSLRTDRPYTARHVPWYSSGLDAEELYYIQHLNPHGIFWSALAQEPFRQ